MKQLVRMEYGSKVYGTSVPTSDTDYRGIFLPNGRDLILQQAPKHGSSSTKKDSSRKNTQDDVDDDRYSIAEFMKMVVRGDTGALDMLFTPEQFWTDERHPSPLWQELIENRSKLLHKETASFAGYCQGQAAKYSLKGSNLAAFRLAKDFFSSLPSNDKCFYYMDRIQTELLDVAKAETIYHEEAEPIIKIVQLEEKGGKMAPYLQIGKKTKHGLNVTCKLAAEIWTTQFDKYGDRAKLAETNEGCDWKALMHALRVSHEAQELLLTGNITFPRPEKDLLLQIRKGELPYAEVAELITQGLDEIEKCKAKTSLPDKPDTKWIEEYVEFAHIESIVEYLQSIGQGYTY